MKKSTQWLALIVVFVIIAIGGYAVIRGGLNLVDKGQPPTAIVNLVDKGQPPTAIDDQAVDTGKEQVATRGIASFYGVATNGTRTASGVSLDDSLSTAAHRTLPFGTMVRVTNLSNGLSEIVKITDRGPFIEGRIIDLSRNAAGRLDMMTDGVVSVEIEVLPKGTESPSDPLIEE